MSEPKQALAFRAAFEQALHAHEPDRVAFVLEDHHPPTELTYGEFWSMVTHLRGQLRQWGVGPGQVVPMLTERSPEAFALMVAVLLEGAAFSMLNPKLPLSQLLMLLEEINPAGLVVDQSTLILDRAEADELKRIKPMVLETAQPLLVTTQLDLSQFPCLQADGSGLRISTQTGESCAAGAAVVAFTSGSTGRPKGVMLSPDSLYYHIKNQIRWGLHRDESILFPVTLAHNFGRNLLFACLFVGCRIHLTEHFLYRKWIDIVKRSRINGITSLLQFWTVDTEAPDHEQVFGPDSSLRFVHIGGQKISQQMAQKLRQLLGPKVPLWKSYGQTEKGGTSAFLPDATNPAHGARLDSVGQAVAGVTFHIDLDGQSLAPPHQSGEILYTGPGAFMGYLGDPELSRQKLRSHPALPASQVLYSGDVGYLDEQGFLFVLGRADSLFKTHGYRVLPLEIEDALLSIKGIKAACAFGVPDARLGDHVVGAVIETDQAFTQAAIQTQLSDLIPRYMIPRHTMALSQLPRNAKGKLARAEIQEMYHQQLLRSDQ